jgi:RNA polymerase sigma-70 factor (ECF subfamily)
MTKNVTGDAALASRFEQERPRLRAIAYRMLGSLGEAEDAVQEAWIRLGRTGEDRPRNLGPWLTTVVSRVCLDWLRSRAVRSEEPLDDDAPVARSFRAADPEQEALQADAVGLAMLVVLERLAPAERVAFVLHDMFHVPFEEIAAIVDRSPTAARQLASRGRRRVQGPAPASAVDRALQHHAVEAFLAASRAGDLAGLIAVLDPNVVLRADHRLVHKGEPLEVQGAEAVARRGLAGNKGAVFARVAIVDGAVGVVVAPRGRLALALRFVHVGGRIATIEVIAGPERLAKVDLAVLA